MKFKNTFRRSVIAGLSEEELLFRSEDGGANPIMSLLAYAEKTLPPSEYAELAPMDCFCAVYSELGRGVLSFGESRVDLNESELALIDCSHGHRLFARSSWRVAVIYITGSALPYFYGLFTERGAVGDKENRVSRLISELFASDTPLSDTLRQLRFLTELFTVSLGSDSTEPRQNVKIPEYIMRIKDLFDSEYARVYTLDMLEHSFHVNKYKIVKDFTEYIGVSPISYLNSRRIDAAKQRLVFTNDRINEIGCGVGYENVNNFINMFKKRVSVTPAAYRRAVKGELP